MEMLIAQHVAEVLRTVAHPVRLQIIEVLEHGQCCVGDIVLKTGHSQSVISQHLGLMKDKRVLDCRREGTKAFYTIRNPSAITLLHCVYDHCGRETASER
jgi:ArsR family transcriptional regulator